MAQIHTLKSEFGLGGGTYLSGSVSMNFSIPSGSIGNRTIVSTAYCYYPIQSSVAVIRMKTDGTNPVANGGFIGVGTDTGLTFTPGTPIYGPILQITQSSGHAFVWNSIQDKDDF
jgi:translation initiation factor 2 gamma subunit (eIF-2gamma)